jgi:DNA-binding transcriptional LysR family regulator
MNGSAMKYGDINFDVRQLRSFCEVSSERSFTRASRKLNIGQATISHHIGQLEKALGVSLITRASKEFSLTEEGKTFREFCLKVFDDIDALVMDFSQKSTGGTALIVASTIPASYIIPPVIAALTKEHPHIHYRVGVSDSREVVERIKEGSAEVGVLGRMMKHPSLTYEKVYSDEIVLIGDPSAPDEVSLSGLSAMNLVMRENGSGTRSALETALGAKGIHPSALTVVFECNSTEGVRESVAAGIGLSFVSRLAITNDLALKKIKMISVKGLTIVRDFYLVHQHGRNAARPVALFIEKMREWRQSGGAKKGANN